MYIVLNNKKIGLVRIVISFGCVAVFIANVCENENI